jgi:hypothetical protein
VHMQVTCVLLETKLLFLNTISLVIEPKSTQSP